MNAIDVLTYGQKTILATMSRYRPDDWDRIALGVWTAKDLLGHLGAFEVRFADILATFVDAPLASDLTSADPRTFNDDQAAIRKDWTIEQVTQEFLDANERVMTHAAAITPERWREVGTIPWYGRGVLARRPARVPDVRPQAGTRPAAQRRPRGAGPVTVRPARTGSGLDRARGGRPAASTRATAR